MTFDQIQQLWIKNGGDPGWAPLMAGIAIAESGGDTAALNNNPNTGDYSVGLWQINYYGSLLPGRTAEYGSPAQLQADPNAQAKAAISLFGNNAAGIGNWTNDPTWNRWVEAGRPQQPTASQVSLWLGGNNGSSGPSDVKALASGPGGASQGITCTSKGGGASILGLHLGTACQLKALTGGLLVGLSVPILMLGIIVLVRQTNGGKQVTNAALTTLGPVGKVAGTASSALESRRFARAEAQGQRNAAFASRQYAARGRSIPATSRPPRRIVPGLDTD